MKFYQFSDRYKQIEKPKCVFTEWNGEDMTECGKEAYGSLGAHGGNPLCEKHFKYAQAMYGVGDVKPIVQYHKTERSPSRKPIL
jgi:hypothetical protein